jgi:D-glycero-alpha-D-manno-heptose-7-phosphate kinase
MPRIQSIPLNLLNLPGSPRAAAILPATRLGMMRSVQPVRTIDASAPIRICDNGGWTDTWVARHGKVFNIAVRPLVVVRVDVFPRGARGDRIVINAENYGDRYAPPLEGAWGPHPLLEASIRAIEPPRDVDVEITIRSKAPPAASTGTSAAVAVALLGALDRLAGGRRSAREIAYEAHAVETVRLGQQSGIQDQLCSAFGGVNFIDITDYPHATVSPVDLDLRARRELQRRLSLVYLGRPHRSSAIHENVMRDLRHLGPESAPLNALRTAAGKARDAIRAGDFEALGAAMRENTAAQAALHAGLVSHDATRVIDVGRAHGAIGWKVNGAGGDGGSITLLTDGRPGAKRAMLGAIQHENPAWIPIPIVLSAHGLRVSESRAWAGG